MHLTGLEHIECMRCVGPGLRMRKGFGLHQMQPIQCHGFQRPGSGANVAWMRRADEDEVNVLGIHNERQE